MNNSKMDIFGVLRTRTAARLHHMDFAYPIIYNNYLFIFATRNRAMDLGNFAAVFSPQLWLAVLLVFLSTPLFLFAVDALECRCWRGPSQRLSHSLLAILNSMGNISYPVASSMNASSARCLIAPFTVLLLLVFSLFQSGLVSRLCVRELVVPAVGRKDLAAKASVILSWSQWRIFRGPVEAWRGGEWFRPSTGVGASEGINNYIRTWPEPETGVCGLAQVESGEVKLMISDSLHYSYFMPVGPDDALPAIAAARGLYFRHNPDGDDYGVNQLLSMLQTMPNAVHVSGQPLLLSMPQLRPKPIPSDSLLLRTTLPMSCDRLSTIPDKDTSQFVRSFILKKNSSLTPIVNRVIRENIDALRILLKVETAIRFRV